MLFAGSDAHKRNVPHSADACRPVVCKHGSEAREHRGDRPEREPPTSSFYSLDFGTEANHALFAHSALAVPLAGILRPLHPFGIME